MPATINLGGRELPVPRLLVGVQREFKSFLKALRLKEKNPDVIDDEDVQPGLADVLARAYELEGMPVSAADLDRLSSGEIMALWMAVGIRTASEIGNVQQGEAKSPRT